jgi:hypothetical protein
MMEDDGNPIDALISFGRWRLIKTCSNFLR